MKKQKHPKLFPELEKEEWEKEWVGMPEFIQEDMTSHRQIVVHFRSEADVKEFSELIGQKISRKQPSLWFPVLEIRRRIDKVYIDES